MRGLFAWILTYWALLAIAHFGFGYEVTWGAIILVLIWGTANRVQEAFE